MAPATFAPDLLESLEPWRNSDFDTYIGALGSMFDPLYGIVLDTPAADPTQTDVPGWGQIFDVDACPTPYLPYLGQFVGVALPPGIADADARTMIRNEAGMQRGLVSAMLAAATRILGPGFALTYYERTGPSGPDPYQFQLFIVGTVPPAAVQAAVIAAVGFVKPGGIKVNYYFTDGIPWDLLTGHWDAETYSWNDLPLHPPPAT